MMQAYPSNLFPLFKAAGSSRGHQMCFEIPKNKQTKKKTDVGDPFIMLGPLYARAHSPTQVRFWLPNPKISGFKSFIFPFGKIWMRPFCSANINMRDQNQGPAVASSSSLQSLHINVCLKKKKTRKNSSQWIGSGLAVNGNTDNSGLNKKENYFLLM